MRQRSLDEQWRLYTSLQTIPGQGATLVKDAELELL